MKYCSRCGTLYQKGAMCTNCKKPLSKDIDKNDPVFVISAYGFERERIVNALKDNGIPCVEKKEVKQNSAEEITGNQGTLVRILVPYCAYSDAKDILIGIGAIKTDAVILKDGDDESSFDIDNKETSVKQEKSYKINRKNKKDAEPVFEEMSRAKRTTVKVLSIVLFIALASLCIYGVDFIAELIKKLF